MKDLMKVLENEQQYYEYQKDSNVTVFVFSANWCPDCVFIKPFLPELIQKYSSASFLQCSGIQRTADLFQMFLEVIGTVDRVFHGDHI